MENKTIIFQGMCYSGKTTLGNMLADVLGCRFLDSRDLFLKSHNISEIDFLSSMGQPKFKQAERQTLQQNFNNMVLSLGGSAIYYPEEMEELYKKYTIIWLNVPFDVILERRKEGGFSRPIVYPSGIKSFKELYNQRSALYPKYSHIININDYSNRLL